MKVLVGQDLEQALLCKFILKAMKPNSDTPSLLFGLSVEIDQATGRY